MIANGTEYSADMSYVKQIQLWATDSSGKVYQSYFNYDTKDDKLYIFVYIYASTTASNWLVDYCMAFDLGKRKFLYSYYVVPMDVIPEQIYGPYGYIDDIFYYDNGDLIDYEVKNNYSDISDAQLVLLARQTEPHWFKMVSYVLKEKFSLTLESIGFFEYGKTHANTIRLDKSDVDLGVGGSVSIMPTMSPDGANDIVVWSSSDSSVATVDKYGVVNAVSQGEATITARCKNVKATCKVSVKPMKIILNKDEVTLNIGESDSVIAAIDPPVDSGDIKWASSDESIATVDSNGVIKAISYGTAIVTAEYDGAKASCVVSVNPGTITLNRNSIHLDIGDSKPIIATVSPEIDDMVVKWSSSNDSVAVVSDSGLIKAMSSGTAIVTAEYEGAYATCEVTVNPRIIKLNQSEIKLNIGASYSLVAVSNPPMKNDEIVWSSSNESAVLVDSTGMLTSVSAGNAVIKAQCDGVEAICNVSVNENPAPLDMTIVAGQKIDLDKTSFKDMNYSNADYIVNNSKIASVNKKGVLIAKKAGDITVCARKKTGTQFEELGRCNVTVLSKPKLVFNTSLTHLGQKTNAADYLTSSNMEGLCASYWESSNPSVVKILDARNGMMEATGEGTAKITAYFGEKGDKGAVKVSAKIKVKKPSFKKISYNVQTGATLVLNMSNVTAKHNVDWMTTNEKIARATPQINKKNAVTGKVLVKGISYGSTTLLADIDGIQYSCVINIIEPKLSKKTIKMHVGKTATITLKNTKIPKQDIEWISSDPEIVSVDKNGKLYALKQGNASVFTIAGGAREVCAVSVE